MMRTFRKQMEGTGAAFFRRGVSFLLAALLLCTCCLTGPVRADETTQTQTQTAAKKVTHAEAKKMAQPTYLFEVATGAQTKDNSEKNIDFFIVTYTMEGRAEGKTTSKFLFPTKDAWTDTYSLLSKVGGAQGNFDKAIRQDYGYKGTELASRKKPFQAYSVDQYLFTTSAPIKEIKRVQVFAGNKGSWNCTAMRVFSVEEISGLYRWNAASDDIFIDFKGKLLANGKLTYDKALEWGNDRLMSTDSRGVNIDLQTTGFDPAIAEHQLQDTANKTLVVRFDFADVYGAGLEAQGPMSAKHNTLSSMGLAETMGLRLYYFDRYGTRRVAHIPGVLNAAAYTADLLGSAQQPVAGIAQQGEGMAIGVFLPDFGRLSQGDGLVVTLGHQEVSEKYFVTPSSGMPSAEAEGLRNTRIALSEKDPASFVTMAVYDPAKTKISASVNRTTGAIEYLYQGAPLYYQPVANITGNPLDMGETRISLTDYTGDKRLAPQDKTERYLFEVTTDDISTAGTQDDILMRIYYKDLEGNARNTGDINMREASRDFNGWWYGSREQDMGYYKGVSAGQTLRFFVSLKQVKEITDVQIWMSKEGSGDDWQMSDLAIYSVESLQKRKVVWQAFASEKATSPVYYDRTAPGLEIYRFSDTAASAVLIQQGNDEATQVGPARTTNIKSGSGASVTTFKPVDWTKYRHAMTFQEASQNLGFNKDRCQYVVTVHVGGNASATAEDGDCGSKNLFYFRLIFNNGTSAYVLANQQLSSDRFIAGASQSFVISTNQDYGEVSAVQIIPEDSSENDDRFDKLKIDSIDVKLVSNAAISPVWSISTVGWIGIDVQNDSQLQSVTGMTGRKATDMTHSYAVDGRTFDVNFMMAIRTEDYQTNNPQFQGSIGAIINYDSYDPSRGSTEIGDLTKSIYSYMGRSATTSDAVGGRTISDPSLMFRANHTDRMFFSLSDVQSINYITFQLYSTVTTEWRVSGVSIFRVHGEGTLLMNKDGEYERRYQEGEELELLCTSTATGSPAYHKPLQPYSDTNNNAISFNVNFTENYINVSTDQKQWTSVVTREPVSENDTFNLFLYPENGKTDPVHRPVASIMYTDMDDKKQQVSSGELEMTYYNDQEVFYAMNLTARRFGILTDGSVKISSGDGDGIRYSTVRGVLQRVRSGVVLNTWELSGSGSTEQGGIVLNMAPPSTATRQRVRLQLGDDFETKLLAEVDDQANYASNNMAVALWYRTNDPTGMERRSPYIYLTDQEIKKVKAGQIVDLLFNQKDVAEVTGIAVIGTGDVHGTIDAAYVVNEEIDVSNREKQEVLAVNGTYGFANQTLVSNVLARMNTTDERAVKPVRFVFNTALATDTNVSAGTSGPVRMTIGYYDVYDDFLTKTYDDIRPYITDGASGFQAGTTTTVEMLVPDVARLRWVALEPYSDPGAAQSAVWTLDSLTAILGEGDDGEYKKHSELNEQLFEGNTRQVNLADIQMKAEMKVSTSKKLEIITGSKVDVLLPSGEGILIVPKITGSNEGFSASLLEVDSASGVAGIVYEMNDTRGYTSESIKESIANAPNKREAEIWEKYAEVSNGSFSVSSEEVRNWREMEVLRGISIFQDNQTEQKEQVQTEVSDRNALAITFMPPRNFTADSKMYRIVVASSESPDSMMTFNITVKNEVDPVQKKLDELARIMEAERQEEMQKMKEDIDTLKQTNNSGSGSSSDEGTGE